MLTISDLLQFVVLPGVVSGCTMWLFKPARGSPSSELAVACSWCLGVLLALLFSEALEIRPLFLRQPEASSASFLTFWLQSAVGHILHPPEAKHLIYGLGSFVILHSLIETWNSRKPTQAGQWFAGAVMAAACGGMAYLSLRGSGYVELKWSGVHSSVVVGVIGLFSAAGWWTIVRSTRQPTAEVSLFSIGTFLLCLAVSLMTTGSLRLGLLGIAFFCSFAGMATARSQRGSSQPLKGHGGAIVLLGGILLISGYFFSSLPGWGAAMLAVSGLVSGFGFPPQAERRWPENMVKALFCWIPSLFVAGYCAVLFALALRGEGDSLSEYYR